jgi:outer membrane protein OmpA-like peptidoglycan-associated protein
MLAACGSAEQPASSEASEQRSEASSEPPPRGALGELLERNRREGEAAVAAPPAPRAGDQPEDDPLARMAASSDPKQRQMAEALRAMQDLERVNRDPNATEADKAAARERMLQASINTGRRDRNVRQPALKLPPDWAATYRVERNAKEAELLVQVGDIDNLGFGWPPEFDPFSGKSTPVHAFPWAPESDDPPGTDRIMVNSGAPLIVSNKDGYTRETYRPENLPEPLTIEFDPKAVPIKAALLQLFVDDFQAPVMKTRFSVTLDGRPAPDIETTINKLNQTGPIGKLVTIRLLPEYLGLLADGKLQILVDDPTTKVGDGFAFDFARLLINPKGFVYSGTIRGIVIDKQSEAPITGAVASAGNVRQATTNADGRFELREVPAGLVVVTGSHPDYVTGSEQSDLLAGDELDLVIRLERAKNDDLAERLETEGKVDLYGIYFDSDKAVLKSESEATLQQVLTLLKDKPALRIAVAGHTDSQAAEAYNLDLSKRRAQAVVAWLTARGVAASRLVAQGFGETQPVADNDSAAGRALNRRVEIRDLTR